jgi:Carboxypeptidase regulatory-like domain
MSVRMRVLKTSLFLAPLFCSIVSGQSTTPATQVQTFHIRGTLTDPLGAVIPGVEVTLQSEQLSKVLTTNDVGAYEADLPFGAYIMSAQRLGFRQYRRPLFRVTSPAILTVNVELPVRKIVDRVVVKSSGKPVTRDENETAFPYYGDESFPIPSEDGVPYELYIRYMKRTVVGGVCDYTGEKTPYEDPVFVAYNLFSLQADHVGFNAEQREIEASGNVVVTNESGQTRHADSMAFKIENGRAIPVR